MTLPRSPTVIELLDEFKQHILESPKPQYVLGSLLPGCHTLTDDFPNLLSLRDPKVLLPTIIAGLQTYFDRALGANLLYRFERPQYADIRRQYITGPKVIVGQEKEMSSIYGAEHLLRMLGALCCLEHGSDRADSFSSGYADNGV